MQPPRFSIVIPTRDRAETLRYALRTCIDQSFGDYEIIVHDNCSSAATRQVVEEERNEKVRYVRSEAPLAMSDSWERAVSFARGEYVTVIGDDDGLLPHSLTLLDRLLRELSVKLLRWACIPYFWPNYPLPAKRNSLVIPLGSSGHVLPALEIIREVINYRIGYEALPMIYNSAVHRDLIAGLRNRTGRVFHSGIPDVASGFAFAYLAKRYISLQFPLSIAGSSGKSNSAGGEFSYDSSQPGSAITENFVRMNDQAGRSAHPTLPNLLLLPVSVADAFLQVKAALFPNDVRLNLNRKECLLRSVASLGRLPEGEAKALLQIMSRSLADTPHLQKWFEHHVVPQPLPPKGVRTKSLGFQENQRSLGITASDFGVSDVHGAAALCEKMLNHAQSDFHYTIREYGMRFAERLYAAARVLVRGNRPSFWY